MSLRRRIACASLLSALALALGGCLMPAQGTPVFVDLRAGDFWSGKGMLLEVAPDKQRCRVVVRDRALIVHELDVDCRWVHERNAR
jgi:hypothetical protein